MKLLFALLILSLSACGPSQKEKASTSNPNNLSADQEIVMSESSYGCEYLSKFTEAVDHYSKKEYSAWAQITADKPWCFSGTALAKDQTWTVLQIRDNLMQIGLTTPVQLIHDSDRYKHDYWTATAWGSPVPSQSKSTDSNESKSAGKVTGAESFVLQVGAYSNADTSKQEEDKLKEWGYRAYTEKVGEKTRVRVGPYPDRDKAEKVGHQLEKHGLHPVIVSSE